MSKVKKEKAVRRRVTLSGNVDIDKVIAEMPNAFPGLEVKAWAKKGKHVSKKTKKSETEAPLVPSSEV